MKSNNLVLQVRSVSREVVRQFGLLDNRFSSIGSISQCHALLELDTQGVMNLGELSTALNLEKSTTSRLIMQLLDKDMCQIQTNQHDRRNKLITLTKQGLNNINKIHAEASLQVQQALDLMTEEEKSTVLQGLSIYAKALKQSQLQQECILRELIQQDVPQLKSLIKQVRAEFGFDTKHPAAHLFNDELNQLCETYQKDTSKYLVLRHKHKIIGGVGYAPLLENDTNICELKGMYVASSYRGQGLGNLLLKTALEQAKTSGFTQCYLETYSSMQSANALYKKYGFIRLDAPLGATGHTWTNCWYLKNI